MSGKNGKRTKGHRFTADEKVKILEEARQRGTTVADGVREFWTLISPHPDAGLRRLEPGTLLVVLRYDRATPGR